MTRPPPSSTLFPYTTLFRSPHGAATLASARCLSFISERKNRKRSTCPGWQRARSSGQVLLFLYFRSEINEDRKSTRLNSSHANISYAVFCLKKKIKNATEAE